MERLADGEEKKKRFAGKIVKARRANQTDRKWMDGMISNSFY